ncbi:MAG: ABC transporter permease subunit/CPBP intramembrane protease [Planctomycetota bacterium]|jgi:sodium transport system permease protein
MRSRLVRIIGHKELLDTLRDRRTLFVAFVLPLLLYPALLIGMTQIISVTQSSLKEQNQRVFLRGDESTVKLEDQLRTELLEPVRDVDEALRQHIDDLFEKKDDAARAELKQAMVEAQLAAVLDCDDHFGAALDRGEQAGARVVFDPTNEESKAAYGKIQQALMKYEAAKRKELQDRLPEIKDRLIFAERPVKVEREEVASKSQKGAYSFAPLLGMLIVFMALTGAFYPAVDLAAGEKERGTMETLLVAPVSRTEIVLGKFVTIWIIAMVTALLNLAVMGLTFSKLAGMAGPGMIEFEMPLSAVLAVTVILIPTSALFSAVSLALSSFAASYKEGQHYMTPLFLVATPLAMVGLLPHVEIGYGLALVPVANVVLLVKGMLLGGEAVGPALVATLATLVYAAIAVKVTVELFKREAVLFRSGGGQSYDATLLESTRRGLPQEKHAYLLFFVVIALMYFLSKRVDSATDAVLAFVLAQAAVLLPTLVAVKRLKLDARETFRLKPVRARDLAPVVGGAACTVVLVSAFYAYVMPAQEGGGGIQEVAKHFESIPLPLLFALIAILPPICEELACRGFILSALLPRQGATKAILISAALFAVLHLEAYRLPGTFLAGLMLGYVGVRTGSVLATILFHMVYNGILFTASVRPALGHGLQHVSMAAILVAGAGLALTIWQLRRR